MQHITLIGALVRAPETKKLANNTEVTSFSFVVNVFKQKVEHKVFYRIAVWDQRLITRLNALRPGARLALCGKLDVPSAYKDNSGEAKVTLQVTLESMELLMSDKGGSAEFSQAVKDSIGKTTPANLSFGAEQQSQEPKYAFGNDDAFSNDNALQTFMEF